jgi:CHAD domain-containing protein
MADDSPDSTRNEPSPAASRELEWQLAAPDLGLVRRWLSEHGTLDGLVIEPRPTQQLRDTYLDTEDWRIYRAGFALRMRDASGKNEATLKAFKSAQEDVADRTELSERLRTCTRTALQRLRGPVGSRVHAVAGKQPLQPLFEVHTRRQRFAVREPEGAELGEIALDETVISRPEGEARTSFQRVEVEALGGARHKPLEKLVETLRSECSLDRAGQSKYEIGLKSMGLSPTAAPQFAQAPLDGSMPPGEAATATLQQLVAAWFNHEPAARLGDDPEAVHALRVTARRMDAVLALFSPYLPRSVVSARPKVKGLLRMLGDVRDLDVQLANLLRFQKELSEEEATALEPLSLHLQSERAAARSALLRALDTRNTAAWFERLTKALLKPPPQGTQEPLVAVVPGLIRSRFRKLRKAFRQVGEHAAMEDYHLARRRAKKFRYAIEPVATLYGKPAEDLLRTLKRLQDHLGAQQDAHVAMTRLAALAREPPEGLPSLTVFLMGRFAARHAGAPSDVQRRIEKAWRKLRGPRWKALWTAMEHLGEHPPAPAPAPETVDS